MFYSINWIILFVCICILEETKQFHLLDEIPYYHSIFKRQSCEGTQFQCKSGQCIEKFLLCDGNEDCNDSSDETKKQCSQVRCPSYTFRCGYGACIDKLGECDGKKNCADNSDENTPKCPKKCRSGQFECNNGECIDGFDKCDGKRNCADGSDESKEACGHQQCSSIYFRCNYGACIDPQLKCNGENDCADGSDEDAKICGPSVTTQKTTPVITIPTGDSCIVPEPPFGGYYVIFNSVRPNPGEILPVGTILEYKCWTDYVLTPAPFAVCRNGQFNPLPKCQRTCPIRVSTSVDLKCTHYGRIVDCSDRTSLLNGTVLTMKCKDYFHPLFENQNQRTQCIDGTWGAGIMECEPDCGDIVQKAQAFAINAHDTEIIQYPWHVGIYKHTLAENVYEHICGGSIISPNLILSVAHCFTDSLSGDFIPEYKNKQVDYVIAAGKVYRDYEDPRDTGVQKRKIKTINIPPQYKGYTLHYSNDIAILELQEALPRNNIIRSICVDFDYQLKPDQQGTVVGWGATNTDGTKGDPHLKSLTIPVIEKEECFAKVPYEYRQFLVNDHICAGLTNGSSVCQGDSGGGLTFRRDSKRFVIIGLVSNGPVKDDVCDYNQVATYTDIREHKDFVSKLLKKYS